MNNKENFKKELLDLLDKYDVLIDDSDELSSVKIKFYDSTIPIKYSIKYAYNSGYSRLETFGYEE